MRLYETDVKKVVDALPDDVRDFIKDHNITLAGGFIRAVLAGEEISDIDLFSESEQEAKLLAEDFSAAAMLDALETENAYTIRHPIYPVQFIHRWTFKNPNDLIASFDYTIAQAAIWHDGLDWRSVAANTFLEDLHAKHLTYTAPDRHEDAGGSLLRMRKFLKRGYDISSYDMAKVIARMLNGVDMDAFPYQTENSRALQINEVLTDAYGEPVND